MMTIDEMRERMKTLGYSYRHLSERSGVPLSTVQKILGKVTKSPRYDTLAALEAALDPLGRRARDTHGVYAEPDGPPRQQDTQSKSLDLYGESRSRASEVREHAPIYGESYPGLPGKKQGEYTLDDYLALPDDRRVELIDGVFYDMTGPSYTHQSVVGQIHWQLINQKKAHTCPCHPFVAPADVQLDCDNRTIVQPDVLVVCDLSRIQNGRYFGAPDFVVEVLSPSTRNKDMFLKAGKYQNAGVRELWLVDPKERRVMSYDFREGEVRLSIYGFEDKVPVLISDGDCAVDFALISEELAELFPEGEERNER